MAQTCQQKNRFKGWESKLKRASSWVNVNLCGRIGSSSILWRALSACFTACVSAITLSFAYAFFVGWGARFVDFKHLLLTVRLRAGVVWAGDAGAGLREQTFAVWGWFVEGWQDYSRIPVFFVLKAKTVFSCKLVKTYLKSFMDNHGFFKQSDTVHVFLSLCIHQRCTLPSVFWIGTDFSNIQQK